MKPQKMQTLQATQKPQKISLEMKNISLFSGGNVGTTSGGGKPLVTQVDLSVSSGELVALIGPNGAGKTSLLRAATGLVRPQSGAVLLAGKPIETYTPLQRARLIGYLPQARPMAWPNLVEDLVALGRYPYGGATKISAQDDAIVTACLHQCEIAHLRHRHINTLSGGEQARVHCARVFAAQTPLLIADEPIAALDPRHQYRVMDLLAAYVAQGGGAIIVLHDIALAARHATRLVWMRDGEICADGTVADTLNAERLHEVFDMRARVDLSQNPPEVIFQAPSD